MSRRTEKAALKIVIITCYNQPDYVRAKTLRSAARRLKLDVIVVKNRYKGILRYAEVFAKVLLVRLRDKPDVYLLTFRGYEMLLPVRLLSIGKPLIYDEFINPIEWVVKERRQVEAKQGSARLYSLLIASFSRVIVFLVASPVFKWAYRKLVKSAELTLADTRSHAEVSAELTGASTDTFLAVPVGTDEGVFAQPAKERSKNDTFTVFYYGNMLPLHGLKYVIEAAVKMKHDTVRFVLVGGNAQVAHDVALAVKNGANIDYRAWVDFEKLPKLMYEADLCLAGPFGGTFQSRYVITGKASQYMAMGRPTVVGANEESALFADKENALVAPQADADALADTIRWAMDNSNQLGRIGDNGKKLYETKLSVAVIMERLTEALARLGFSEAIARKHE